MNKTVVTGLVLLVLGIAALVIPRVNYTEEEQVLKIGPLEATAEREKSIPIPPAVGWVLVIAGIGCAAFGFTNRRS